LVGIKRGCRALFEYLSLGEALMDDFADDRAVFLTLVRSAGERPYARLLIDSIRAFGGDLSRCPVWLFETDPRNASCGSLKGPDTQVFSLSTPDAMKHYYFADKVYACARAEEMATPAVRSLIWIDPACLVIRPPLLFALGEEFDAAVRPVHIKNVGLSSTEPLDAFWKRICEIVGLHDIESTVETFVDARRIRSYFNSHAFAVNPARRLLTRWFGHFETLVSDHEYQKAACGDERHQVFLHQAVLSALLVARLDPARLRLLPPEYNYPYNLHGSVQQDRRAAALNDVVCIAYERRSLDPARVDDIEIHEPLRSWLSRHVAPGS
jgi:hypothetical protein